MAFSKKNKRKITVSGCEYFYSVTGQDGWINLIVMTEVPGSPKLTAYFEYHQQEEKFTRKDGSTGTLLGNQFVITPYTVRKVIEYALTKEWNPLEKGKDLNLRHLDEVIDLRLDQNRADTIKTKSQPVGI